METDNVLLFAFFYLSNSNLSVSNYVTVMKKANLSEQTQKLINSEKYFMHISTVNARTIEQCSTWSQWLQVYKNDHH